MNFTRIPTKYISKVFTPTKYISKVNKESTKIWVFKVSNSLLKNNNQLFIDFKDILRFSYSCYILFAYYILYMNLLFAYVKFTLLKLIIDEMVD